MRPEEIRKILQKRPFEPVRIYISSGQHVDITHPEMMILGRSYFAAGVPPRPGVADYVVSYSLIHVVRIVPLHAIRAARKRRKRQA